MRFIKGFFAGIGIGIGVALVLYASAYILELLNCVTCGILTCQVCGGDCGIRACDNSIGRMTGPCGVSTYGIFPMWSSTIFFSITIFCGVAGTVIGTVYGIATQVQEGKKKRLEKKRAEELAILEKKRAEEEKQRAEETAIIKQRQAYANEFLEKSNNMIQQCINYSVMCKEIKLQSDYSAVTLQKDLLTELDNVSIRLQRLDDIVSELKTKEGK